MAAVTTVQWWLKGDRFSGSGSWIRNGKEKGVEDREGRVDGYCDCHAGRAAVDCWNLLRWRLVGGEEDHHRGGCRAGGVEEVWSWGCEPCEGSLSNDMTSSTSCSRTGVDGCLEDMIP